MKSAREKELELITITDRFVEILHELYGFYIDAHKGFLLYRDKIEEARKSGVPRMIWANKPPTDSDVAFYHSASPQEIVDRNRPEGPNILKTRNYIVVMLIEHWNCDIRIKIAEALELADVHDIKSDIMGDLNKIRQDILHKRGKAENAVKNKIIPFKKDDPIEVSPELFELIFINIFKDLNDLCIKYTGKIGYQDHSLNPRLKDWQHKRNKELFIWR